MRPRNLERGARVSSGPRHPRGAMRASPCGAPWEDERADALTAEIRDAPPHSVMSKTSSWGRKNCVGSQPLAGQLATGMPS